MKIDIRKIPHGLYCYSRDNNGKFIPCPYHELREDQPRQENGFCHYLGIGDWEFYHPSLLWDSCKECGINEEEE